MVYGHLPDRWCNHLRDGTDDILVGNQAALDYQVIGATCQNIQVIRARKEPLV